MKKQVSPVLISVVLVLVVIGASFFLWHAATDKPAYPGLNAGHPSAETAGRSNTLGDQSLTYDKAKTMHIPGMAPGAQMPKAPPRSHGQ